MTPAGGIFEPIGWAPDSTGFYVRTTYWGGEFTAVGYHRLDDASLEPVVRADWDIEQYELGGGRSAWTINEAGWCVLYIRYEQRVPDLPNAVIDTLQVSADGTVAALLIDGATRPAEIAIVDLNTLTARYLTDSRPAGLQAVRPVEPDTVRFPSAEGRTISALQYRPVGTGPFPMLMWIHGGPHGQARPIYERLGLFQYLLTQNIGVLCPDASGSTGYGTTFKTPRPRLGQPRPPRLRRRHPLPPSPAMGRPQPDRHLRRPLRRLRHPVLPIPPEPPLGRRRLGLRPLQPGHLSTTCPPTWRHFVDTILGNPQTDTEHLTSRSPVTHAHQITAPLYVIQGAQDPRVPQSESESDQIVNQLRARGAQVRYDIYPDEGHGFTNRTNEIKSYPDITTFLPKHLQTTQNPRDTDNSGLAPDHHDMKAAYWPMPQRGQYFK